MLRAEVRLDDDIERRIGECSRALAGSGEDCRGSGELLPECSDMLVAASRVEFLFFGVNDCILIVI